MNANDTHTKRPAGGSPQSPTTDGGSADGSSKARGPSAPDHADRDEAPEHESGGSDVDQVLIHGVDPKSKAVHVLRRRGETLEAGTLRPVEDGKPLTGDLVSLQRREEFPLLFDVKVEVESPLKRGAQTRRLPGPAKVATKRFRDGWDAIWGAPDDDELPQ